MFELCHHLKGNGGGVVLLPCHSNKCKVRFPNYINPRLILIAVAHILSCLAPFIDQKNISWLTFSKTVCTVSFCLLQKNTKLVKTQILRIAVVFEGRNKCPVTKYDLPTKKILLLGSVFDLNYSLKGRFKYDSWSDSLFSNFCKCYGKVFTIKQQVHVFTLGTDRC